MSHVCASDYMKLVFREQERRNRSAQGSRDERQYGKREKQRQRKRQTEIETERDKTPWFLMTSIAGFHLS